MKQIVYTLFFVSLLNSVYADFTDLIEIDRKAMEAICEDDTAYRSFHIYTKKDCLEKVQRMSEQIKIDSFIANICIKENTLPFACLASFEGERFKKELHQTCKTKKVRPGDVSCFQNIVDTDIPVFFYNQCGDTQECVRELNTCLEKYDLDKLDYQMLNDCLRLTKKDRGTCICNVAKESHGFNARREIAEIKKKLLECERTNPGIVDKLRKPKSIIIPKPTIWDSNSKGVRGR